MIQIYVDGCRKKDGRGGWAAILMLDKPVLLGGFSPDTTNNKMELSGPLQSLKYIVENSGDFAEKNNVNLATITSDSDYFVQGFNSWMHKWRRLGWRRSKKQGDHEVKNLEMWQALHHLHSWMAKVEAVWVRGHNGHKENELCDKFANFLCKLGMGGDFRKTFNSFEELETFIHNS